MSRIGVALIGYGTIGNGVAEILQDNRDLIKNRTGVDIELMYAVDKDWDTPRRIALKTAHKSSDYKEALNDPNVHVVVELVGGTGFAYTLVEESLKAGKNVVCANKALLAEKGAPLFALARNKKLSLGFEASVCGGIPVIRTVNDALAGDRIRSIHGIVNGTTNYILTKMFDENQSFETALKDAQKLGFAEADPTLDINGHDAAHKLAILASLAFNTSIDYKQIYAEGIDSIDLEDVRNARELGYVIKLLAITRLDSDGSIEVRVHPTLVPNENQLAFVRNEFNAVLIDSEYLTNSMYYGRGAGSRPTATAVVADIIDIAKFKDTPDKTMKFSDFENRKLKPIGDIESRYYLRLNVLDKPGTLSRIAGILGNHSISLASVIQKERSETDFVPLIMTTHSAIEKNIRSAIAEIEKESFIKEKGILIRIMA